MLREKHFIPYILFAFINTFIDVGHKILIQNTVYNTTTSHEFTILSSILNALILIPYILFFTPAGFIADRFPKARIIRWSAATVIPLTLLITCFYYWGFFWAAFTCTFLLGIQSAINSPAKYGFIREQFGSSKITKANAWIQSTVIIAILGATFTFTSLFSTLVEHKLTMFAGDKSLLITHLYPLGFILLGLSIIETILAFRLPEKVATDQESTYEFKKDISGSYARKFLSGFSKHTIIYTCIIGLSLFWAINQVLLAAYGAFLKENVFQATTMFAQGYVPGIAGIGILLGAATAGKLSKYKIETRIIPVAAIGLTIGLACTTFFTHKPSILLLFLLYGYFGGMFVVPLNALIQFYAQNKKLGKTLAINNFIQNVFMISFLLITVAATMLGLPTKFLLFGLISTAIIGALYIFLTLKKKPFKTFS